MTAGLETVAAEDFLFAALTGDATLVSLLPGGATAGVFNSQAPQGTAYPFVVYQFMSGVDYAAVGAFRIWANLVYLVKVVAELDHVDAVAPIIARIDAVLHRSSGVAADGTVWSCVREQVIRVQEDAADKQYVHSGAMYRLCAT